ncbi:hypothetical protein D3C72_1474600 [compost metagenome]
MARPLVVEGEALAVVADVHQPAGQADEAARAIAAGLAPAFVVGRAQGGTAEQMEQVHQQQFLVLLLMGKAELHQGNRLVGGIAQQHLHMLVHMAPVGQHPRQGRPGQQPPLRAWLAWPEGLVVGVEEIGEAGVEDGVAGQPLAQQEGLEEPGRVGQVPLGGAGIGHGLHHHVLFAEGSHQRFAVAAYVQVLVEQCGAVHRRLSAALLSGLLDARNTGVRAFDANDTDRHQAGIQRF